MDSKNNKKSNIQKGILKILAEKPAVSLNTIKENKDTKENYALSRSIKNLVENGCVEVIKSDNQNYLKLTKKGQGKLNCIKLEGEEALVSNTWDGFWRIIILDIPEERKLNITKVPFLIYLCVLSSNAMPTNIPKPVEIIK